MTEQEVDRRCAIYGTILGVVVAGMIVALFVLVFESVSAAQRDYEAGQTKLRWRTAGSSFGPYNPWHEVLISPSDHITDAVMISGDDSAEKWVLWVSGPPACSFTGHRVGNNIHASFQDRGGGRDITETEPSSFFFHGGWGPVWVLQGTCSQFDISTCTGWCR